MCINRDMKMAVVRPTQSYLQKTMHYFSHRIAAQKQLASQLFPISSIEKSQKFTLFDQTTGSKHWEENVTKMRSLIAEHKLFTISTVSSTSRGLVNVFNGIKATNEQTYDLNARKLGQQDYTNFITHHILQCS